jgi:hypothetical protein
LLHFLTRRTKYNPRETLKYAVKIPSYRCCVALERAVVDFDRHSGGSINCTTTLRKFPTENYQMEENSNEKNQKLQQISALTSALFFCSVLL